MRRRSGTLDIYAWKNPEQYEAEFQCIASNEYGAAYSNKIMVRLYSKFNRGTFRESAVCLDPSVTGDLQWPQHIRSDSVHDCHSEMKARTIQH